MKVINNNKRRIKMTLRNESLTKVGIVKEELTFPLSDFLKSKAINFSTQKILHN